MRAVCMTRELELILLFVTERDDDVILLFVVLWYVLAVGVSFYC